MMISRLALAFAIATSVAPFELALADNLQDEKVWLLHFMEGCSAVPPNGYFWVDTKYNVFEPQCITNFRFVFESHFDKPVGAQMTICEQGVSVLPPNWYLVSKIASPKCVLRLNSPPGPAWVVQKG